MGLFSKKNPCPPGARRDCEEESNPLVDLVMSDPMFRREFLDNHERMPLWAKAVFHVHLWWGDLIH